MRYATVPINYTATTKRNVYDFQAGVTLEVTMPAATVATEFKVDGGKLIMVEEAAMPTSDIDLIPYAFDPIAYYTASPLMKPPSDLGMSREFKRVAEERLNSLITINTQMQQQRRCDRRRPSTGDSDSTVDPTEDTDVAVTLTIANANVLNQTNQPGVITYYGTVVASGNYAAGATRSR